MHFKPTGSFFDPDTLKACRCLTATDGFQADEETQPTAASVAYLAAAIGQPKTPQMIAKTVATNPQVHGNPA